MSKNVKQIGEIGVDAGLCWIGDPCYVLHKDQPPKAIGKDWREFCSILNSDNYPTAQQFHFDRGHTGLGVCVSTGYGDGLYPVYAKYSESGRIAKVWVEFIEDEPDGSRREELQPEVREALRDMLDSLPQSGVEALRQLMPADPRLLADLKFVRNWFTENGLTETYHGICDHLDEAISEAEERAA